MGLGSGINAFRARAERNGAVGGGGGRGGRCWDRDVWPLGGGKKKKKNSHRAAEQGGCCLRAALRFPDPFPPAAGPLAAAAGGGRAGRTLGSCCAGLLHPESQIQPRSGRSLQCVPDTVFHSCLIPFSAVSEPSNNKPSYSRTALSQSTALGVCSH